METISALVEPGEGGSGGLAVRYDEAHHYSIEWKTEPSPPGPGYPRSSRPGPTGPGGPVELRIETREPNPDNAIGSLSSDTIALQAVIDG